MATVKIPVRYIDTTVYTATIDWDTDAESPREWDNLGTMICSHRSYTLGDEQADTDTYGSWEDIEKMLRKKGAVIVLPLGLYDHSGITMYVGDIHDRWDGGQVGFIYVTRDKLLENFRTKRLTKKMLALAEANLRAEVETYDTYLRDEVYSVTITNPKDSNQEQCSGLFGIESIHEFVKECIGDAEYVEEWL